MQAFFIVRKISTGSKLVNGYMTMQATVNFGTDEAPEIATRHLQSKDGHWTGWNSDGAIRARAEIIKSRATHQTAAKVAELRLGDIQTKLDGLKGKRSLEATAERKNLHEAIKTAKVTVFVTQGNLEKIAEIAERVDETHPEIVQFLA
jgi:hypothetical protein